MQIIIISREELHLTVDCTTLLAVILCGHFSQASCLLLWCLGVILEFYVQNKVCNLLLGHVYELLQRYLQEILMIKPWLE